MLLWLFTDGCIWNNRTLTVGASFDKGCESTCTCLGNDTTNCRARCVDGQRPKGSFMSDSFCTEEPIPNNPCCVTVVCPSSSVSEPAIVSHLAFPDEMDDTPTTPGE